MCRINMPIRFAILIALPLLGSISSIEARQGTNSVRVKRLSRKAGFERFRIETRHYQIYLEKEPKGASPTQVGLVLEAAYELRKAFFLGKEPPRSEWPLKVKMYGNKKTFQAGLKADKANGHAPGHYSGKTHTAYTAHSSALGLAIHEATHQFHWLAWGGKKSPQWFSEGVAEYFALHDWNGSRLLAGTAPYGWRSRNAEKVKRILKTQGVHRDPSKLILGFKKVGATNDNYAIWWAWNCFLINDRPAEYVRLMQNYSKGMQHEQAWRAAFGVRTVTKAQYGRFLTWVNTGAKHVTAFSGWVGRLPANRF